MDQPSDLSQLSDSTLLQRHLDGDGEAFGSLVRRHQQELTAFLTRFMGNRAMAEDAFQEAFLQLHISAPTFDTSKRLKPWLFTIAANKARDALRSKARKSAVPLDATIGGAEDQDSYVSVMPSSIPAPDENIMNFEVRLAVEKIVEALPESLRIVLVLCYFHDFAYKDIAEMLALPLGTVKSRLHGAVARFSEQWKALVESDDG
ncbi:MAG: sigma-70 family RNA polymerase sigma factor [Phycisphaerales bacterium]|nr:sigma-70 family RNA polymerase sigma factor [Phycisphaerales bacterium]